MPLLDFHTSKALLSSTEKQSLAKSINTLYTSRGLPAFYVNVRFTEHEAENFFNGGEPSSRLVVLRIEHLARQFPGLEHKQRFLGDIDAILDPVLKTKGVLWEYGITEMDRDLWKINAIVPPWPRSEAERKWVEGNWPVEYEAQTNVKTP